MEKTWVRRTARAVLALFAAELCVPLARAQDLAFPTEFRTDAERQAYISEFHSDLNLTQEIERQNQAARERDEQYRKHLEYWRQMQSYPPPQGEDPARWRQHVNSQVQKFEDWNRTNQEHLRRAGERLQAQMQRMSRHQEVARNTRDEIVRQNIGTLAGVTGLAAAPILPRVNPATGAITNPGRITGSEVAGLAGQGGRIVASRAIGNSGQRLMDAGSSATQFGEAARAAREALPTQARAGATGAIGLQTQPGVPPGDPASYTRWIAVPRGQGAQGATGAGHYELHQVNMVRQANGGYIAQGQPIQTVRTDIPVNVQQGQGFVRSAQTENAAQSMAVQRQARTQVEQTATDLRLRAQETAGTKTGEVLSRTGERIQGQKTKLDGEIAQYKETHQGHWAARARQLGASAAKWAAFSAGVAVTSRAIESWRQTGRVDWGYATQDLRDTRFWTGTAGSFVGSMAASALVSGISSAIPGGAFLRTFAAIGGAAVGWQVGSGNLANTDWMQLGATTVGATIGAILGGAFGPVGAILGGMLGHFVADYLLNVVRNWASVPSESYSYDQAYQGTGPAYGGGSPDQAYPGQYGGSPGYAGSGPGQAPMQPAYPKPDGAYGLKQERDRLYSEFREATIRGDRRTAAQLQQQIAQIDQQLRSARSGR